MRKFFTFKHNKDNFFSDYTGPDQLENSECTQWRETATIPSEKAEVPI
jgi:hypothetical protein